MENKSCCCLDIILHYRNYVILRYNVYKNIFLSKECIHKRIFKIKRLLKNRFFRMLYHNDFTERNNLKY